MHSPSPADAKHALHGAKAMVLLAALLASACGHGTPRALRAAPADAPDAITAAAPPSGTVLSDVDLRLVAEAIAYDVSHAPWFAAYSARMRATPTVRVEPVAEAIAGAGGSLDGEAFTAALAQALRNTGAIDVLSPEGPAAAEPARSPQPFVLEVRVRSHDDALEGQTARIFAVAARMYPGPGGADAWQKLYPLRKRLQPATSHAGP